MKIKCLKSSDTNVRKYIFSNDEIIMEAVAYRYGTFTERTVICCSVQSGCPVGCVFCGTGKKFIRNLTGQEIVDQVMYIIKEVEKEENIDSLNARCKKFQIMFMSMGEPFLNYDSVRWSLYELNDYYPNADLLISTMAPNKMMEEFGNFCMISKNIEKIGLQFSLHDSNDSRRDKLIPYKSKLNLQQIRDAGILWYQYTERPIYLNYCVTTKNSKNSDIERLKDLFSSLVFNFTFSVVCEADENIKDECIKQYPLIQKVMDSFNFSGYNARMFDPAGQDDIGGGCGQLWHVQNFFKNKERGINNE